MKLCCCCGRDWNKFSALDFKFESEMDIAFSGPTATRSFLILTGPCVGESTAVWSLTLQLRSCTRAKPGEEETENKRKIDQTDSILQIT